MNQSRDGCQGELLPSPCSPAQQVVSSLCLVCLLALAVAWVIVFNMKSKTDELRVHIYQCAPTNTHLHWPPVYNNKNIRTELLPEELWDSGCHFSFTAEFQEQRDEWTENQSGSMMWGCRAIFPITANVAPSRWCISGLFWSTWLSTQCLWCFHV